MGNCVTKTQSKGDKDKENKPKGSYFNINLQDKTAVFNDLHCPINNEKIQAAYQLLNETNAFFRDQFRENCGEVWKRVMFKGQKKNWWYHGEWSNEKMHGQGIIYNKKYDYLIICTLAKGTISLSQTIKIFSNGSYYYGPLNDSLSPQGSGQLNYQNGICKYTGEFCNGVPHGKGILVENENKFKGQFEMGEKKYGTLEEKGGVYEGYFKNNKKDGKGKYHFKNGKKFEGTFINDNILKQAPPQKKPKQDKIMNLR